MLLTPTGSAGGVLGIYLVYAVLSSARTFSSRKIKQMMGVWEIIYDKIWRYDGAYLGSRSFALDDDRQLSGFTEKERDQLYAEIQTYMRMEKYNNDVVLVNKAIAISKERVAVKGEGLVSALLHGEASTTMRKVLLSYRGLQLGEVTAIDIKRERDDRNSGGSGGSSSGSSGDIAIAALTAQENRAVGSMREEIRNGLLEPFATAGMFQPVTEDMQRNVFTAIYAVGTENLKEAMRRMDEEKIRTRHDETRACGIVGRFFGALVNHSVNESVDNNRRTFRHTQNTNRAVVRLGTGLATSAAANMSTMRPSVNPPAVVQHFTLDPNTPRGPPGTGPTFQEVPESSAETTAAESSPLNMLLGNRLDGLFDGGRRLRKRKVRKKGTKKKARGTKRKARKKGTKKRGRRTKRRTRNN